MKLLLKTVFSALLLATLTAIVGYFLLHFQINWPAAGSALRDQWTGPWSFPTDSAMGLVTVAALWLSAAGWGLWLLRQSGAEAALPSPWQQLALGLLCGWVFLGLAAFGLGLLGLCSRPALGGLVLLTAAWGTQGWTPFFRRLMRHPASAHQLGLSGWVLLGAGLLYLVTLPYALTPAIQSDELRYHLAAPAAWLAAGRIEYLPHQAFSNFPFLIEMLFMIALALQGAEGAHMIHLAFLESCAVVVALLAYLLIRRAGRAPSSGPHASAEGARTLAGLTGVAFAAIPTATLLACWSFVDVATCAYFAAMIYVGALMLVSRNPPPGWLLGVMAGGAIGTKYLMIPLGLGVALYFAVLLLLSRGRSALRPLLQAVGVASLLAAPWLVRNTMTTGNPVYPLAWSVFGGDDWSESNAGFYAAKAAEKGFSAAETRVFRGSDGEGPVTLAERIGDLDLPTDWLAGPAGRVVEFLISPITASLYPEAFESNFLGPMPLAALVLALAGLMIAVLTRGTAGPERRSDSVLFLWVGGVILGAWLFWFLTYQSNRMLLTALAPLFAAGGWGVGRLARLFRRERGYAQPVVALAVVLALGLLHAWSNSAATVFAAARPHPLPRALGFGSSEDYIASAVNYYEAARWLDGRLAEGERALLIGEHRTLYFPPVVVASDWFDTPQPLPLIRATADNDALFERLRAENIVYVFYNEEELQQYVAAYFVPRFSPGELARFQAFLNDARLRPVHKDPKHRVYVFQIAGP